MEEQRLRIPQQTALDIFTRIDEELAQIIIGLNTIIDILRSIESKTPQPQETPPIIPIPQPPGEYPQPPIIPHEPGVIYTPYVVSMPAGSKLVYTDILSIDTSKWYKLELDTDIVVIVPDDDILIAPREDQPGFLVESGVYFILNRSSDFTELYLKASENNTRVWIAGFNISKGG